MFVLGIVHILLFRTQLERWGKAGTRPQTQAGDMGRLPAVWLCPADHSRTGSLGWRLVRQGLKAPGGPLRCCELASNLRRTMSTPCVWWGQCLSKIGSYRKRTLCPHLGLVFLALGARWVLVNQPFVLPLQVPSRSLQVASL